ncbi:hypothetical protein HT031_000869 [Scenedesmus sp. PABB004]|nr:hypothetical protein HT031_000869 [Scenedesmus sp. PABB004]
MKPQLLPTDSGAMTPTGSEAPDTPLGLSTRRSRGVLAAAACVCLAVVAVGAWAIAHPASSRAPASLLVPLPGDGPVDCAGCLNNGQPPIPRFQFDTAAHKMYVGGVNLGKGVIAMPQKLGGGVTLTDLETGRTLASLWYSNYGDYGAIPHHIISFPSENPYNEFELLNSCQGGLNTHLYNLPNVDPHPPASTNIYRLRYDGNTLMIAENVSDSTGLGLGVHTTINPKDAKSYAVSDGQKDVWALFDRATTEVRCAFRYDWQGNTPQDLANNWKRGGVMTITRIYADPTTGKYDLLGAKGNKIDVELAPMAEGELEKGRIPGASPATTVAADGFVFHPGGRWGAEIIRMLGGAVVHDLDAPDCAPLTFISFNVDTPDQAPVVQTSNDTWTVRLDYVGSPGHELGWTPDGKSFLMMNNLRENSVGLVDSTAADPRKWVKRGVIKDPLWRGEYPNPFHMAFSHDSKKAYFVVLRPPPQRSNLMVVDMVSFHIIKEIQGITPDMQSAVTTMDGKYLLIVTAGFQRFASGVFVLDIERDEPLGFFPAPGGHHDIALVPTTVADMKYTRAICM